MRTLLVAALLVSVLAAPGVAAKPDLAAQPEFTLFCERPDLHGTVNDAQACANAAIDAGQRTVQWALGFACQVLC